MVVPIGRTLVLSERLMIEKLMCLLPSLASCIQSKGDG
jgi:hypothetical protein